MFHVPEMGGTVGNEEKAVRAQGRAAEETPGCAETFSPCSCTTPGGLQGPPRAGPQLLPSPQHHVLDAGCLHRVPRHDHGLFVVGMYPSAWRGVWFGIAASA